MKQTEDFSIGALSERSEVNIETIRYYEKIGIMPAPARSAAGYRIYGVEHVRRLHFVRRGRELGFSLDELRNLLRLVDGHAFTCAEVNALTVEHLRDIRRKIVDLQRLERAMSDMAAQCKGDQVPECPIIDALFEMRSVAGGARPARARRRAEVTKVARPA
ncbi:MerR family transcriptional regulator (plasmid) [Bradyrhizobium sp. SK17]|jgi:MerR family mercuric resistance operon transcriptional regulator|uniref:MerR family transcriptional regulator n=1 Tax=Bradyrhizobium sp. SK17 TaxID=2057741 RepID=UPI000C3071BB|nr:helix-turn-helix domain-containing protein [Bradyrhizobium sp. SK17]AUD00086.1 MerR family transcriptional regulator [Bradyrhizobium sp. SK17]MBN8936572.1 helix-turn-helix domain-containing protein [Hyphomicrobiales bacterium]